MDHIRYPIGEFQPKINPTHEEIIIFINQIPNIIEILKNLLEDLGQEQLDTSYRSDGWTIRQIIHHIADNDMNAYLRFKRALTEQEPVANSYREDLFAELDDYENLPVENSLLLIEILHKRFFILLIGLNSAEFKRGLRTKVLGLITLDTALQRFIWHASHHIAQIESLIRDKKWKEI